MGHFALVMGRGREIQESGDTGDTDNTKEKFFLGTCISVYLERYPIPSSQKLLRGLVLAITNNDPPLMDIPSVQNKPIRFWAAIVAD